VAALRATPEALLRDLELLGFLVDTTRCGTPAALGVVTASGYAYRREDGVNVVPITALGP